MEISYAAIGDCEFNALSEVHLINIFNCYPCLFLKANPMNNSANIPERSWNIYKNVRPCMGHVFFTLYVILLLFRRLLIRVISYIILEDEGKGFEESLKMMSLSLWRDSRLGTKKKCSDGISDFLSILGYLHLTSSSARKRRKKETSSIPFTRNLLCLQSQYQQKTFWLHPLWINHLERRYVTLRSRREKAITSVKQKLFFLAFTLARSHCDDGMWIKVTLSYHNLHKKHHSNIYTTLL